jgi:DNA-binding transcriptional regulator YdaS (Cro superfamily)
MKTLDILDSVNGADLARQLGVSRQLVSHWRTGRCRVPAERCRDIERATGGKVTVYDLRPDIFGTSAPSSDVDNAA